MTPEQGATEVTIIGYNGNDGGIRTTEGKKFLLGVTQTNDLERHQVGMKVSDLIINGTPLQGRVVELDPKSWLRQKEFDGIFFPEDF